MKNLGITTRAEAAAETEAFADAVMAAIGEVAKARGQVSHLPCLLGALAGVVAYHLAGIDDMERRSLLYGSFGEAVADGIVEALQDEDRSRAHVLDNSRPLQ